MEEIYNTLLVELNVKAVQMETDIWMQGHVDLYINGEKPYLDSDIVDAELLIKSLKSDGDYFIFSCCCGIPQCSKWLKPINVTHEGNKIRWFDANSEITWHFDKNKLEEDIINIVAEVKLFKQFFKKKRIEYVGVGYNW